MLSQLLTWWNNATVGTSLTLLRRGARLVGTDADGNRYYEEARPAAPDRAKRRWVVYNGVVEASRVTPDWHGWLHYTFDDPPLTGTLARRVWEKAHQPNMTGTPLAYRPAGSLAKFGTTKAALAYTPWNPDET